MNNDESLLNSLLADSCPSGPPPALWGPNHNTNHGEDQTSVSVYYSNENSAEKPEPPFYRRLAANVAFALGFAQHFALFTENVCISTQAPHYLGRRAVNVSSFLFFFLSFPFVCRKYFLLWTSNQVMQKRKEIWDGKLRTWHEVLSATRPLICPLLHSLAVLKQGKIFFGGERFPAPSEPSEKRPFSLYIYHFVSLYLAREASLKSLLELLPHQ